MEWRKQLNLGNQIVDEKNIEANLKGNEKGFDKQVGQLQELKINWAIMLKMKQNSYKGTNNRIILPQPESEPQLGT